MPMRSEAARTIVQRLGKTRRRGRHRVVVALLGALVWGAMAAPGAFAEAASELDATTQAQLEAIRERLAALLAETPSDQRETVRRELLRVLETTGARAPEPETAPTEAAVARQPLIDRPETHSTSETAPSATTPSETAPSETAPSETAPSETTPPETASATAAPSIAAPVETEGAGPEGVVGREAAATPPVAPPPPSPPPRRARAPRCTTLLSFDENGDGKVNAQDRWWRHLYVWIDRDGDRQLQERELESAYERGVREIEAGLDGFYRKKGSLGEVRYDDTLLFDLGGDGFGAGRRPDDGALAVDATALRRGSGPSLEGPGGAALEGIQPFRQGQYLVFEDGRRVELTCRRR